MTKDEELEQLRTEKTALCEALRRKDEELEQSHQANQDLREGLKQAIMAIEYLQERVKALEGQQAKDSHNSSLPPSSDRFVRPPKSLRKKSGKKPGGQKGHRGHHLQQAEIPDQVLIHPVERCERCQHDLREQPADMLERRQVMDLPVKRLWITEHRVEEKQCPVCYHLTRARFPPSIKAPAQYGTGIQALAVSLLEGQYVPYARATKVLRDLLGIQLQASSIASFVEEVLKQAWARKMKDLLLDMKAKVERAKAEGKQELDVLVLARLLRRYDELLKEGYQANPAAPPPEKRTRGRPKQSPARNLLNRLSEGKWAVLRFLHDFAVPFDNNLAERDLRMIKVQQKVSGCFRTEVGVTMFCRIRSYLSTLRKQGMELLSALDHTLSGHPVLPAFS